MQPVTSWARRTCIDIAVKQISIRAMAEGNTCASRTEATQQINHVPSPHLHRDYFFFYLHAFVCWLSSFEFIDVFVWLQWDRQIPQFDSVVPNIFTRMQKKNQHISSYQLVIHISNRISRCEHRTQSIYISIFFSLLFQLLFIKRMAWREVASFIPCYFFFVSVGQ